MVTYSDGQGGVEVGDGGGGTGLGEGHLAALATSGLAGEESGLNSEAGAQPGGTVGRGLGEGSQSGEHVGSGLGKGVVEEVACGLDRHFRGWQPSTSGLLGGGKHGQSRVPLWRGGESIEGIMLT